MSKFTTLLSSAAALTAGALALPGPVAAQNAPNTAEVIVYGSDP